MTATDPPNPFGDRLDEAAHLRLDLAEYVAEFVLNGKGSAVDVVDVTEYVLGGTGLVSLDAVREGAVEGVGPVAVKGGHVDVDEDLVTGVLPEGRPVHQTPGTAFGPSTRKPEGPMR